MNSHEIDYEIKGHDVQFVEIDRLITVDPLKQFALVFHGSHQVRAASQWDLPSDNCSSCLFCICT